jgi:polyribonucleotide nucleotidyltransferase
MITLSEKIGGRAISVETGRMAKQASGSAVVRYGDTVVLVTATADRHEKRNMGFTPLAVHYVEKMYAAGRIPGGFFKREGRLSDRETLISRFIDRPIRPLFPEGWNFETQIVATVLSTDHENEPAVAAMLGASAALQVSDIPIPGPLAGVRVGRINGEFIANPTPAEREQSDLDLFVAATKDAVLMVEGEAKEVSEAVALDAIMFAHKTVQPLIALQEKLAAKAGKAKRPLPVVERDEKLAAAVDKFAKAKLAKALSIKEKQERYAALDALKDEVVAKFYDPATQEESVAKQVGDVYADLKKRVMREAVIKNGERVDGRSPTDIREITCEPGILPRTHGSALFTRGETQALVTVTLGSRDDEQMIDALSGISFKGFLFHYNFPPFSVGETTPLRGPGRREIGHGFLAEKGITAVLPAREKFPYTMRVVSEILESNGSSSMASVCGSSLALMDAGVPIKCHVAGIAMGLIQEKSKHVILSDILGDEDHLGDMDFKVAGTHEGITALQMDIKIEGINKKVLEAALKQAREGRMHILGIMEKAQPQPREGLSQFAPRFVAYKINESRIKDVIGPGGRIIRGIVEKTGAKIDVSDDGMVTISGRDAAGVEQALQMVKDLTAEIEIGTVYHGPVKKIMDFGAFVELVPGTDGLVHISQMREERVERVEDVLHEGDMVSVKVIGFDRRGKLKLTMLDVDA